VNRQYVRQFLTPKKTVMQKEILNKGRYAAALVVLAIWLMCQPPVKAIVLTVLWVLVDCCVSFFRKKILRRFRHGS
jgi:hypothetical protein